MINLKPLTYFVAIFAFSITACNKSEKVADHTLLTGKWLRPDGGYILEIGEVDKDKKTTAKYFNPGGPINVESAEISMNEIGNLSVTVVLQDRGYPGSTYTLQYLADTDRLIGSYTQPASGQVYQVYFIRQAP
ncbi:MAG: hypothetical protein AAGA18_01005 [Verrucomicrobiota bacterium]